MKISIITPVYNGKKTLEKCINSVINQTYQNWELIIVNDLSTDNSIEIIEKFIKIDKRIILINKDVNEKTFKARIDGLKKSTGDYFTFIDQDDWFEKNAIEKLILNAIKTNADVVLGSWRRVFDNYGLIKSKSLNLYYAKSIEQVFENDEIKEKFKFSLYGGHSMPVLVWSKLYKAELKKSLVENEYPNLHIIEDLYINLIIFENVNKISFIKDLIINWRYGGISQKHKPDYLININELYKLRKNLIINNTYKTEIHKYIFNELSNVFYYYLIECVYLGKFSIIDLINEFNQFKTYISYQDFIKYSYQNIILHENFFKNLENNNFEYIENAILKEISKFRIKRNLKRFFGNLLLKF